MIDDAPPSDDEVRRIRDRAPGWEELFNEKLAPILMRKVTERASKHKVFHQDDLDDFVSIYMLRIVERLREGTLLDTWEEGRSVVGYLTRIIDKRVADFFRERNARKEVFVTQVEFDAQSAVTGDGRRLRDGFAELCDSVRLDLPESGNISRIHEMAGIQLYPRLDWDDPRYGALRDGLVAGVVCPEASWTALSSLLQRHHEDAARELDEQRDRICAELERLKHGSARKGVTQLETRLTQLRVDEIIMPLSVARVCALLDVSENTASQYRSRYRKELPSLLPDLWARLRPLDSDMNDDESSRRSK